MDRIELKAASRAGKGNGPARKLRREGRVPAILYGPGCDPVALSVDEHELDRIVKQGSLGRKIIDLAIDDGQNVKLAMIKELQSDPVSRELLHVDFYEIAMDRKIRVHVPVTTTGKAKGVELGGLLQIVRRELEVLCLPDNIPQGITVDITELGIGDSVHVSAIDTGGRFEIPHDHDFTVLTVSSPKQEAVEGEAVPAEAAETEADAGGEAE